jgi:hypothetical protein
LSLKTPFCFLFVTSISDVLRHKIERKTGKKQTSREKFIALTCIVDKLHVYSLPTSRASFGKNRHLITLQKVPESTTSHSKSGAFSAVETSPKA